MANFVRVNTIEDTGGSMTASSSLDVNTDNILTVEQSSTSQSQIVARVLMTSGYMFDIPIRDGGYTYDEILNLLSSKKK